VEQLKSKTQQKEYTMFKRIVSYFKDLRAPKRSPLAQQWYCPATKNNRPVLIRYAQPGDLFDLNTGEITYSSGAAKK
jgi:hypothetical protein